MLYREPKLLKVSKRHSVRFRHVVSVLYREPKLLKVSLTPVIVTVAEVSVLYREPKLLKDSDASICSASERSFSALP